LLGANITLLGLKVSDEDKKLNDIDPSKPYETWTKFENLLSRILKARLVPALALEDQCIRILRTEWDSVSQRRGLTSSLS
jgi:hypothetical protein